MVVVVEVQESAQIFERNRPSELLLVEFPHFRFVDHPKLQTLPVEQRLVFIREKLFGNKFEGGAVHVLPLVLLVFLWWCLAGIINGRSN
jgi:hypothetical protein